MGISNSVYEHWSLWRIGRLEVGEKWEHWVLERAELRSMVMILGSFSYSSFYRNCQPYESMKRNLICVEESEYVMSNEDRISTSIPSLSQNTNHTYRRTHLTCIIIMKVRPIYYSQNSGFILTKFKIIFLLYIASYF